MKRVRREKNMNFQQGFKKAYFSRKGKKFRGNEFLTEHTLYGCFYAMQSRFGAEPR